MAYETIRLVEKCLHFEFGVSRQRSKDIAHLFLNKTQIKVDEVRSALEWLESERREKIKKELEAGVIGKFELPFDGLSLLHGKKIKCPVCGGSFIANAIRKPDRKRLAAHICSERCWFLAKRVASKVSRDKGIGMEASFNFILCQLLRRESNAKNKAHHGRFTRNTVL